MIKQLTFVIVASVGVCVLTPGLASAAPRRVPSVTVNTEKATAEAEARLRKASERASRAARKAGLKANTTTAKPRKASNSRDIRSRNIAAASARREAVKKAIRKRLQGGNIATEARERR